MLRVLIISDKPFLRDALISYSAYADVLLFDNNTSDIDGYDIYISEQSDNRENTILVDIDGGLVSVSKIVEQLDHMLHKTQNVVEYKDLKLDIPSKTLIFQVIELDLTSVETNILKTLFLNVKFGASRDYLLNYVLGYTSDAETKALENHIYKLRKKLESIGAKVVIVKTNDGYKIS